MDPLTHTLSGLVLANLIPAGDSRIGYTATLVIAANLPDIDFITKPMKRLGSPKYYHNVTHSILGVLSLSLGAAWALHAAYPYTRFVVVAGLMLLGSTVHIVLDTLRTSSYVRLLWPLSLRQTSMELLVGLSPYTASKRCGKTPYLTCPLCQLRSACLNPFLLSLGIGWVLSLLLPASRFLISAAAIAVPIVWSLVLAISKRRVRKRLLGLYPEIDPRRLRIYPSHLIPFRWLAISEGRNTYRIFDARDAREPKITERPQLPKPETLEEPLIERSKQGGLYGHIAGRLVYPYAQVHRDEHGGHLVTWTDLRFSMDPRVALYTLKCRFDANMLPLSEEFRERWYP